MVSANKESVESAKIPSQKASKRTNFDFGRVIREYRLKAHLEQGHVAIACGVTANAVCNWERGRANPDISLIPSICSVLHMPLSVFFGIEEAASGYTKREKALISNYRLMTLPNRRQLRTVVNAILLSQEETRKESLREDYRIMRGHAVSLAAGVGISMDDEPGTYPVFVRLSPDSCRADDVFQINGQSMEPYYPDGSMVYVRRVDPSDISYGCIVACIVDGVPLIKVYEEDGLHSYNPSYKTIQISEDNNVRLIGKVLGLVDPNDIASEEEAKELREIFSEEIS